jgi:hypothetical protein
MLKTKTMHMSKGRAIENESEYKQMHASLILTLTFTYPPSFL